MMRIGKAHCRLNAMIVHTFNVLIECNNIRYIIFKDRIDHTVIVLFRCVDLLLLVILIEC